ncbi:hypothetical protein HPP92_001404 [Vanilla planifolia]|uniref:DUF4005 domain-containing protein n=1 Tax=Vanilla planifolia TaxID=51239 RepID=A0A835SCV0_VANPL|nr:hypothetical protein HPP92_001404 [Vanilla planifolia]
MGRSSTSCFKIMACAGDSASKDDLSLPPESRESPEKRRWSFRRKSTKHHAPSKSLISEAVSIKSDQEAIADTINSEKSSVPQQALNVVQKVDSPQLQSPGSISTGAELVVDRYAAKVDYKTQEDDVILLQASIRRYLAKRQLKKFKNVVKLQACFRGYLVRRQASGTLRCLLAILKIQTLVRASSAVQPRKFTDKGKFHEELSANMVKMSERNPSKTSDAIRNLVSNAFACQVLKYAPKRKPICIRCDPSKMDPGWKWLERWMVLISLGQQKITSNQMDIGKDTSIVLDAYEVKTKWEIRLISSTNLAHSDLPVEAEVEGSPRTNGSGKIEHEVPATLLEQCSIPLVQDDELMSHVEEAVTVEKDEHIMSSLDKESSDFSHYQILSSTNAAALPKLHGNMDGLDEAGEVPPKNGAVNEVHEIVDMEGGQVVIGSRKLRNPSFTAVQAKFEGLSSASTSNKPHGHASKDALGESKSVTEEVCKTKSVHFLVDKTNEVGSTEKLSSYSPVPQGTTIGGGTEIPEAGLLEAVTELRILESSLNIRDLKVEANGHLFKSNAFQTHGMIEMGKGSSLSIDDTKSAQVEQQLTSSNIFAANSRKDVDIDKPSQEGSPRSLLTIPDSHGTPSSQISSHGKTTTKVENNVLARKNRNQTIVKNSPTNSKNDSGTLTSGEHLQRDVKNGKRRNSFGMAKIDHADHELRSSVTSSLPSYMQSTESARAKVNLSMSQKSSPELNDRENHIKKRHSLPSEDGKQGSSPRMQRSTSHAQQNWKGNGVHSPHNSSERRWLR